MELNWVKDKFWQGKGKFNDFIFRRPHRREIITWNSALHKLLPYEYSIYFRRIPSFVANPKIYKIA